MQNRKGLDSENWDNHDQKRGHSHTNENYSNKSDDTSYDNMNRSPNWSQPVRNDEVPQTNKSFHGKGPKKFPTIK